MLYVKIIILVTVLGLGAETFGLGFPGIQKKQIKKN